MRGRGACCTYCGEEKFKSGSDEEIT
jgi:hypothetical protein